MTISSLPTAPNRGDPTTFADRADAFVAALPVFVTEANALQADVNTKQTTASTAATTATTQAAVATAAATTATATANATLWVSGTTYALGANVFSPTNYQTYRRIIAGAGTTDPYLDTTNWIRLSLASTTTDGSTSSGSITINSGDPYVRKVTPTTWGQSATAAAATTFNKGAVCTIFNNSAYDYAFKDSTGVIRAFIPPFQKCDVDLAANSTSAGEWVFSNYKLIGITANAFSTISSGVSGTSAFLRFISLDSNRSLLLYGDTSCYARVFRKSTGVWGSPVLVRATIAGFVGIKSATDQVIVVSNNSTTGMEAVALSINSSTDAITVNTAATATLAGNWSSYGQIMAVGSSFVVCYGRATTVTGIRAMTVSGTTITIGSESAVNSATATPALLYLVTSSVILTLSSDTTSLTLKSLPYTVSGSTLSAGTSATTTSSGGLFRSVAVGTRWHVYIIDTTLKGIVVSVSGTTATHSVATLSATIAGATSTFTDIAVIGSTKSCYIGTNNSTVIYSNILTDTSGTASAGTEISLTTTGTVGSGGVSAIYTSGNTTFFSAASASQGLIYIGIDASGASPVVSSLVESGGATVSSQLYANVGISGTMGERTTKGILSTAGVLTISKMGDTNGAGGYAYGLGGALFKVDPLAIPGANSANTSARGLTAAEAWYLVGNNSNNIVLVEAAQP